MISPAQFVFALLVLLLLTDGTLGKLPPTIPPCPAAQVARVSRCQETAKRSVDRSLPSRRQSLLYLFTDRILNICKEVQSYSKCTEHIYAEECDLRENSYYEDHEVLSIYPLCQHKYLYERFSRLYPCLSQYRSRLQNCQQKFRSAMKQQFDVRGRLPKRGWVVNEEVCRLLDDYQDCVASHVIRRCRLGSLQDLAVLLVQAAVPHSYNCTVLRDSNKYKVGGMSLRQEQGNAAFYFPTDNLFISLLTATVLILTLPFPFLHHL